MAARRYGTAWDGARLLGRRGAGPASSGWPALPGRPAPGSDRAGSNRRGSTRRGSPTGGTEAERIDTFPWLVTLACLALIAHLWFRSTAPALREGLALQAARRELVEDIQRIDAEADRLEQRLELAEIDVQTLLVALDEMGMHPDEVLRDDDGLGPEQIARALRALGVPETEIRQRVATGGARTR